MTCNPLQRIGLAALALAAASASTSAAELKIDYSHVDMKSAPYKRFKGWVDAAVSGNPGYEFSAVDAVTMFKLTSMGRYCDTAVGLVQQQVDAANARIAAGARPAVAGDSYLEAGPRIAELSLTWEACGERITPEQRTQWSAYADRTIANIWNPKAARWGETAAEWTGWSIDNPGNNYYYSFVEATMHWGLVSDNAQWLALLRDDKLPALQAYFAKLPGGGSLEGTGYGAAHMRLFALYRVWKDSTGVDLANANSHANDSIRFWVHATMPTFDRFAPIGDQSRVSVPEIYDYHRRLVLEARILSNDEKARDTAAWWLHAIALEQMTHGFNYRHDLLPAGEAGEPPATCVDQASWTGIGLTPGAPNSPTLTHERPPSHSSATRPTYTMGSASLAAPAATTRHSSTVASNRFTVHGTWLAPKGAGTRLPYTGTVCRRISCSFRQVSLTIELDIANSIEQFLIEHTATPAHKGSVRTANHRERETIVREPIA